MSGHESSHSSHCQNCRAELTGPYCAQCGQHDIDYTRSFGHIVEDSLEGMFHLDGKFFQSAKFIFTRPGFLTNEFLAGRRTRYANPLRFYIFASFILFFFSFLTERHATPAEEAAAAAQSARFAATLHGTPGAPAKRPVLIQFSDSAPASSAAPGFIRVDSLDSSKVESKKLSEEFFHLLPTILFLCLPLMALLLKLVYRRNHRPYIAHIIFALHLQALVFLCVVIDWGAVYLVSLLSDDVGTWVRRVLTAATVFLVACSFHTVYRQGWVKTVLKMVSVAAAYLVLLLLAFAAEVGIAYAWFARGT